MPILWGYPAMAPREIARPEPSQRPVFQPSPQERWDRMSFLEFVWYRILHKSNVYEASGHDVIAYLRGIGWKPSDSRLSRG